MLVEIVRAYGGQEGYRVRTGTLFWCGAEADRPSNVEPQNVITVDRALALVRCGLAGFCEEDESEVYRKMPRPPAARGGPLLDGMQGLGDNLYQRAILQSWKPPGGAWLITSWPQLYSDLAHIHPVRPSSVRLRTQAKNAARAPGYVLKPPGAVRRCWTYAGRPGSILEALGASLGHQPAVLKMTGPRFPRDPRIPSRPYVLVRPATIRAEWRADARNPRPEYIAQAAAEARRRGFLVVSVADLQGGHEWPVLPLPPADLTFHAGELSIAALMAMVAGAAAVIGGVGWLLPAALSYRVPMALLYGGWGGHNGPQRIFDPRLDHSWIFEFTPDRFCQCTSSSHACDKTISDLETRLHEFFDRLDRRQPLAVVS